MDMALRPLRQRRSMSSRYGSLALAVGRRLFSAPESVVTSAPLAGFAASGRWSPHWPVLPPWPDSGPSRPAAYGNPRGLQISGSRFPADAGRLLNRRSAQPSRPSAITCCFFSSFKTLLTLTEPIPPLEFNVLTAFSLAGFQVTTIGRFWVTAEGAVRRRRPEPNCVSQLSYSAQVRLLISRTSHSKR
jgi:hypothetical protein